MTPKLTMGAKTPTASSPLPVRLVVLVAALAWLLPQQGVPADVAMHVALASSMASIVATAAARTSKLTRRRRHKAPDRLSWLGGTSSIDEFRVSPKEWQSISLLTSRQMKDEYASGNGTKVPLHGDFVDLTAGSDA